MRIKKDAFGLLFLLVSGAEARVDFGGFLRGLKPPPPAGFTEWWTASERSFKHAQGLRWTGGRGWSPHL